MGDIFRRNAFNLGLHVVQSPEAVADARDGDEFTFDPATRQIANVTQGKTYEPVPLTPKEDEIRRSGGIFAMGRREFRSSVERDAARSSFPTRDSRGGMSTTEQIIWAHRVDKDAEVKPGATLRVYADLLPASDGTAPFAIHTFNQITGGDTIDPRQAAIANDHFVFTGKQDDDKQTAIGRQFAAQHGIEKPYYATPGDGIFHFYFPEQGLVLPGPVHSRRRLALARLRRLRRGRASASARRRSASAGRPATSTSRWRSSGACASPAGCSPGSPARTSCSSCCGAGARSSRRACRWSSSTSIASCRSRIATPSPT